MKRISCRWAAPRLPLLAANDLLGEDRRVVERHARTCPPCAAQLASLRSALQAIAQVHSAGIPLQPTTSASLWPELQRRIQEERREPAFRFATPLRARFVRWTIAAALLATASGAAYGVWTWSPWRIVPPRLVARRLPRPVIHPPAAPAAQTPQVQPEQPVVADAKPAPNQNAALGRSSDRESIPSN